MLLQNNQIAASIRSGIVGERIVWQTQSRHEVGTLNHLHSDKWRGGVHNTL